MNARRLFEAIRDRLRPSAGCLWCDDGYRNSDFTETAPPCTCNDRCESPWCDVSRISSGSFIHTHRVQSDADRLFDVVKDMPRRDRPRYPWQRR